MEAAFTAEYLLSVLLVFVRIGGLLVAAPFFSQPFIPVPVRVLLAVLLAFSFTGLVVGPLPALAAHPFGLMVAFVIEAGTGVVLGVAAQFVFWMAQFAGEILGFQMSLGLAQVYNPMSGESSNPLSQFLTLVFLLIFLLISGHHVLIGALAQSFEVVPLAGAGVASSGPLFLSWMSAFFDTAFRLAAPFIVALSLVDVALGIFARVVPQTDLFSLGLPVKLLVGLGLFYLYMGALVPYAPDLLGRMADDLLRLLEALSVG